MEKKEMTRDQLAYAAPDLYDGGWRASDRDQFQQEYDFTDWEADVMQEELEKLADRIAQEEKGE